MEPSLEFYHHGSAPCISIYLRTYVINFSCQEKKLVSTVLLYLRHYFLYLDLFLSTWALALSKPKTHMGIISSQGDSNLLHVDLILCCFLNVIFCTWIRLWQRVTRAINAKDQTEATQEKYVLEEAQRQAARERKTKNEEWTCRLFELDSLTGEWHYKFAE